MNKPKIKRNVNRNLFFSKLHLFGLSLRTLGQQLNPPVSKFRVHQILYAAAPDYRLREIAAILKTKVQTIWPKEKEVA
jgi:lambda repressor-like predicted transcriptional regulator